MERFSSDVDADGIRIYYYRTGGPGGHSVGAATTLRPVADYPELASCAVLEAQATDLQTTIAPGAPPPRNGPTTNSASERNRR
ncbi:MAG: hypothetical protein M3069_32090 [Chloroflexota bacterium]|nr:hypothetical protein [Chloroflexota bacterium]